MTRTLRTLCLAGTALFVSGLAYANPKADTNQDGQITQAEFIAHANARFERDDADNNGFISQSERESSREARKVERSDMQFARMDANNDGVITKAEFDARVAEQTAKRTARMDVNGDGVVDKSDREARMEKRRARMQERRAERGEREGRSGKRWNRAKVDANGDDLVSRAEHDAATLRMFEHLDRNNDGVLTQDEGRRARGMKRRGGRH